jgi:hypothetical protein
MRATLGSIKDRIGKILNICPDDARVAEYVNLAIRMLLPQGKWVGTYQRYRIQASTVYVVWPRQIETIEAWALDDSPGMIRNEWFEYLGNGPGQLGPDSQNGRLLVDRGETCVFDVPRGTDNIIQFYADNPADAGQQILLNYLDCTGHKVLTNGVEGEYITLAAPPTFSNSAQNVYPGGVYGIQKPVTKGTVRCYVYNTVSGVKYPIGYYEPSETLPSYRSSLIPGLADMVKCGPCCSCITVMAKMAFIPVAHDTDWLLITNTLAIEYAVQAIRFKENSDGIKDGTTYEAMALKALQDELNSWLGDGAVPVVRFEDSRTWGGGGVVNWI